MFGLSNYEKTEIRMQLLSKMQLYFQPKPYYLQE